MSGFLHLAKSLFEIGEIDQPEENTSHTGGIVKMLQVIEKDVTIAKQEDEEDSDDDDSTDENFVGDTIQKFVEIFNERSSVYVIGAPGSGKTTFIEEMTTLVGCNSVTKPNMVLLSFLFVLLFFISLKICYCRFIGNVWEIAKTL